MPEISNDRSIGRAQTLMRGLGELAAFNGAAAYAVFQFCIGRFPDLPRRRPEQKSGGHVGLVERVTND